MDKEVVPNVGFVRDDLFHPVSSLVVASLPFYLITLVNILWLQFLLTALGLAWSLVVFDKTYKGLLGLTHVRGQLYLVLTSILVLSLAYFTLQIGLRMSLGVPVLLFCMANLIVCWPLYFKRKNTDISHLTISLPKRFAFSLVPLFLLDLVAHYEQF